jgi:hypothetical protein
MELLADEFVWHSMLSFLGIIIHFYFCIFYFVFPFTPLPMCVFKIPIFVFYLFTNFFFSTVPYSYLAGLFLTQNSFKEEFFIVHIPSSKYLLIFTL